MIKFPKFSAPLNEIYIPNRAQDYEWIENIQEYEFCNDFILGIDKSKKNLFFYKQSEETTHSQVINLQEIDKCVVIKKTRSINDKTIALIELNFIKKNEVTSIIIYDEKTDLLISNELLVANKWSLIINSSL